METSILKTVKKLCGLPADYTPFDEDIILFTNGVFSTLNQLGLGVDGGFAIDDETAVWNDFMDVDTDPRFNSVKTYICLKVRLSFDPPTSSFALTAMQEQVKELEWRLNVVVEGDKHPYVEPVDDEVDSWV